MKREAGSWGTSSTRTTCADFSCGSFTEISKDDLLRQKILQKFAEDSEDISAMTPFRMTP